MRKVKNDATAFSLKERIKKGLIAPDVQKQLSSLSKELGLSEESLAELSVMMYRMYGSKA